MEVITWLNSNSGAITGIAAMITAFATAVLVVITGFYAWVTRKMLEENRQMRLDAQKPEIAIYLRSEKTMTESKKGINSIFLYVENIRMAPAYDVEFNTDLSFSLPGFCTLRDVGFLEFGIRYLPPGQKRQYFLGNPRHGGFNALMEKHIEISVTYKDSVNEKYDNCFCLDFREHSGK